MNTMSTSHVTDATCSPGSAPIEELEADLCVVGGGMAGVCAAIAAARRGCRTVLLQDRAVLGGNASSEVRMWICGAHGADNKETGILEEIQLENLWRNQRLLYPVWDTVLFEKARFQDGLTTLLSCAVTDVIMEGGRIAAVRAWHLTRQRWIRVRARLFADCSGDSVLRYSGALCRWGREGADEFGESHAPAIGDRMTMGNSCLIQLRECDPAQHAPFVAPEWAHRYPLDHHRLAGAKPTGHNFWWLEVGGVGDTIGDADAIRDELLRIAYGSWAFIKNHPDGRGRGWELEWIGVLPGKRENVRYVGDHILTQGDIEACGVFPDVVCHGGWSMDDHHPRAFEHPGAPTVFHPAPSPYGIPYRCLYSRNVPNLLFAGRNISCTHMAMSSTRVMATCATMGQAVGTAAALAVRHGIDPRGVHDRHLSELQNLLLDDDQWLPDRRRVPPALTAEATLAASVGDPEPLRDGFDRRCRGADHVWIAPPGATATYRFAEPKLIKRVRIVGDSQLHRGKGMPCSWPRAGHRAAVPPTLPRDLRVEALVDGSWREVASLRDNRRRLVTLAIDVVAEGVRLVVERGWSADEPARLFAFEVGLPDPTAAPAIVDWPVPAISGRGVA
jgi:hypothetical protein